MMTMRVIENVVIIVVSGGGPEGGDGNSDHYDALGDNV